MKSPVIFMSPHTTGRMALSVAVMVVGFLSACQNGPASNGKTFPKSSEVRRVTSPDGFFDAVLVEDACGPPAGGGVDFNVYIVRKGASVYAESGGEIFSADPMTGGELVWRRDHLLEIHYDTAYIHRFRNLWGLHEVENVGSTGERDFEVEIRLVPASDSSALLPDGTFRRPGYH